MRLILSLMAALVALTATAYPREIESDSIHSDLLNRYVHYSVIVPSDFDASRSYKVLYMFHGTGDGCDFWLEYSGAAKVMDRMSSAGEIDQFVMVMPEGYMSYFSDSYDGTFPYETFFVNEFMPAIEKKYSVSDDRHSRAMVGFSMGGFGAVSIGLHHLDKFASIYSMSLSIRTDQQYMTEAPLSGWNEQWGHNFGAVDSVGEARLTDWYKAHSPYHQFQAIDKERLKDTKFYFHIGDKEGRLARSNEEFHRMLLARGIDHEWIVTEGGHNFAFWNTVVPEVFRRFSPATHHDNESDKSKTVSRVIDGDNWRVFLPKEDVGSNRRYAILYVRGEGDQEALARHIMELNDSLKLQPLALGFIKSDADINATIKEIERTTQRVRTTQRLRALLDIGGDISAVNASIAAENMFSAVALLCPQGDISQAAPLTDAVATYKRYPWFWIWTTATDASYSLPSELHVLMRERTLTHEYRVTARPSLAEIIKYLNNRIHV